MARETKKTKPLTQRQISIAVGKARRGLENWTYRQGGRWVNGIIGDCDVSDYAAPIANLLDRLSPPRQRKA